MNEQPTGTASETSQPDPRKNRLWGNEDDLLERLCSDQENPYKAPERTVVFLVGAGLSQPDEKSGSGGVPNTEKIAELLLRDLHLRKLPRHERAPTNLIYQELFDRFYSRSGPEGVGAFLRKVVSEAYVGREQLSPPPGEAQCSQMEENLDDWMLPPGTEALGAIAAEFPERFGKYLLTTNFDPLLAVAIRRARGRVVQTALHGDSNPGSAVVRGTHLVHLHGYWYRDQLHKPEVHGKKRSNLHSFLQYLIHRNTIVVMGYGGWEDEFTNAVRQVVAQFDATPDVLWCIHADDPTDELINELSAGIARGRVCLYTGIDCNEVLPKLLGRLHEIQNSKKLRSAWKQCYLKQADGEFLNQGAWVLISSHGPRYTLKLEIGGAADIGGVVTAKPLFDPCPTETEGNPCQTQLPSPTLGFLEGDQPPVWQLNLDGSLTIFSNEENYGLRIPRPLSGAFHWCREYFGHPKGNLREADPLERLPRWSEYWRKSWLDEWEKKRNSDQRARELWGWAAMNDVKAAGREYCAPDAVVREPLTAFYVAIHLVPWPPEDEKGKCWLTKDMVTQGHWIKFGSHGGTYVVKLDANGELTEWNIFNLTRRMSGRWWIDELNRNLRIWLRNWCLTVPCSGKGHPIADGSSRVDDFFVECTEKEAGSNRKTPFKVVHLLSGYYQRTPSGLPHSDSICQNMPKAYDR